MSEKRIELVERSWWIWRASFCDEEIVGVRHLVQGSILVKVIEVFALNLCESCDKMCNVGELNS